MRERVSTAPLLGIRLVCVTDYSEANTPRAYIESLQPAKASAHVDLLDGDLLDGDSKPVRDALTDLTNAATGMIEALGLHSKDARKRWAGHALLKIEAEADALLAAYNDAEADAKYNAWSFNANHRWVTDCDGERRAVRV